MDEESKCLFLRIRDPSPFVLDDFILDVFGYKPCDEGAKVALQALHTKLGDFRNKFNKILRELVELKKSRQTYV